MIDHEVLRSAWEVDSFVDQSFLHGLEPVDHHPRPGAYEDAVDVSIVFGQLQREREEVHMTFIQCNNPFIICSKKVTYIVTVKKWKLMWQTQVSLSFISNLMCLF